MHFTLKVVGSCRVVIEEREGALLVSFSSAVEEKVPPPVAAAPAVKEKVPPVAAPSAARKQRSREVPLQPWRNCTGCAGPEDHAPEYDDDWTLRWWCVICGSHYWDRPIDPFED
jgi:hypothetical protein